MRVSETTWMMLADYLKRDDRAVLPLGSVEQHAYLSLATDAILAERVAMEAAEPLGVPVFPVLAYGVTPYFLAFPGSLSLRVSTYLAVVRDLLDALDGQGFHRIALVNGHGGNNPVSALASEWMGDHPRTRVVVHNWWNAPRTWAAVQALDPLGSHGSWMENFPWNRVGSAPAGQKPLADMARLNALGPLGVKELLGDGNYGGVYEKQDEEMLAIWRIGVEETRAVIDGLKQ